MGEEGVRAGGWEKKSVEPGVRAGGWEGVWKRECAWREGGRE